eukprot:gene12193-biopygen1342
MAENYECARWQKTTDVPDGRKLRMCPMAGNYECARWQKTTDVPRPGAKGSSSAGFFPRLPTVTDQLHGREGAAGQGRSSRDPFQNAAEKLQNTRGERVAPYPGAIWRHMPWRHILADWRHMAPYNLVEEVTHGQDVTGCAFCVHYL